ncbi:flagellar export chaperone FliS [Pseudaquabacterium pictum]|jgi:flagellar secretion chaperone FliS|uniref:Flagellar secretion chaperone FliS n=1 Tax=Pseudaquabacterium pictum TaxID=2315236 RepID=A0A480AX49_9BURK|nr:flagellar export chaperone FliS [Rubrivivax pictus]GCL65961.1 flagellar protein FliS [Rubrivivax pictus]
MFSAPHSSSNPQARQFAGAYHQVGVQTMVASASAHGLVALLFDGFMAAVHRAKGAMRQGDIAGKGQAIGHAVRIIDEGLKSALDLKAGGKLAADLSDLYAYVCLRLIQANLNNDEAALDECLTLVTPLRDAWQAIGDRVDSPGRN